MEKGDHDFAAGSRIAGNMSGKKVNIRNQNGHAGLGRCTADAFSHRYADAGRKPLKGSKHQFRPVKEVKSGPVDVAHVHFEQGRGIGQIGGFIRLGSGQFTQLRKYGRIIHAPSVANNIRRTQYRPGRTKTMKLAFKKIDAFASGGSAGNPAGAVYVGAGEKLEADAMQRIARELKGFVSETGFVFPDSPLRLKYYSSEREVDFCGHATIAVMYDYFADGPGQGQESVVISTNRGMLEVYNRIPERDAVFIMAPVPEFRTTAISRSAVAEALGLTTAELDSAVPVSVINAGLDTLLVPVSSLDAILAMKPDFAALAAWCVAHGVDIVEVFCRETVCADASWRVRVFCPRMGYLEDPATGSGNSAFGYYLLENGLWDGGDLALEQNGERELFNRIRLATVRTGGLNGNLRVLFGGGASVKIEGFYFM